MKSWRQKQTPGQCMLRGLGRTCKASTPGLMAGGGGGHGECFRRTSWQGGVLASVYQLAPWVMG